MDKADTTSMRSLGRLLGRIRVGFLDGFKGDDRARSDSAPQDTAEEPGDDSVRVIARRTTVVEEVQIIEPERR